MTSSPLLRALTLAAALAGCANPDAPEAPPAESDAPPSAPSPPAGGTSSPAGGDGAVLEAALRGALGSDAGEVRYVAGWADLDGDGRAEAVARPDLLEHVAGRHVGSDK